MSVKKLNIFFIPPNKLVNGGIMSIFSLCNESRQFVDKDTECAICVYPGEKSYKQNDLFENDEYIYEFDELLHKFKSAKSLLLQIPEYAIEHIVEGLRRFDISQNLIRINVLDQNIDFMPSVGAFSDLLTISPHVTQTTAHERYSTQETASKYATPLIHLSVYLDKKQYNPLKFNEKKDIILYSPDGHLEKERIISRLEIDLPGFELQEINNLTYAQYKEAVRMAKYVITFGEGLDGYLIESSFSGTVAFSVFNEHFFPSKDFLKVPSIYGSYEEMANTISSDIKKFESDSTQYELAQRELESRIEKIYDNSIYKSKLKRFYKNDFDFYPSTEDVTKFIQTALNEKYQLLHDWQDANQIKDERITELEQSNSEYKQKLSDSQNQIDSIQNSISWRVTKPVRLLRRFFK